MEGESKANGDNGLGVVVGVIANFCCVFMLAIHRNALNMANSPPKRGETQSFPKALKDHHSKSKEATSGHTNLLLTLFTPE